MTNLIEEQEFIIKYLNRLAKQFKCKLQYEYQLLLNTHIINTNNEMLNNIEFILYEIKIEEDFELTFHKSKNEILFISNESLIKIKNIQYEISY